MCVGVILKSNYANVQKQLQIIKITPIHWKKELPISRPNAQFEWKKKNSNIRVMNLFAAKN